MSKLEDNKGILIGLGAAAAVGLGVFAIFLSSEEVQEKSKALVNRQRAKYLVRTKLDGNDKVLKAVDKLDDSSVNNLLSTFDSVNDLEDQLEDKVSDAVNFLKKAVK
ncbi:Uncharacterised protein [Alloiococcus otitis]|uniref:Uncharacterized protein n=1 Tax=Alloiococcus otitis ATCC 51267 TaxID=883081 RepID=K9ER30_9LACT|nr:hypothetical protein [Alloiococcus otitis]EKU93342.1 hypothetical protein HMPREF9698_01090 [Alloiococcus otitis ATCC 51267]SUU81559.1 Uncharacterised protein [Alloiococcus otitis]